MNPSIRFAMRAALSALVLVALLTPGAQAQMGPHQHHHPLLTPADAPAAGAAPAAAEAAVPEAPMDHSAHLHSHAHDVGPAGRTYDLRWIDGMVQHHTGALRMGEFVFDIGSPGVGIPGQGDLAGSGPGDQGDGPVA